MKRKLEMKDEKVPKTPWWQPGLALFARLSAWIGGPVIIAVIIGKYLDLKFHSEPWLFLFFVAVAFIVSIVMIVKIGLREMESNDKQNKEEKIKR